MTKWIIAVVVVVVVALGAWWFINQGAAPAPSQGAAVETAPAPDTSDSALIQDSASIDAQIQQLDAQQ